MPAFRPRIRALAVGVGAFALVAVGVGGTVAASNPATLYACYDAYGNVRMGDTAQCKLPGGGRLVNWSTVGVPGPTGATGATGPTGPTGPTGAPGAGAATNLVHVVFGATADVVSTSWMTAYVQCSDAVNRLLGVRSLENGTRWSGNQYLFGNADGTFYAFLDDVINAGEGTGFSIFHHADITVANPAHPTDGRHILVTFMGTDATGCFLAVTG
jgi:hypothetical protein